MMVGFVDEFSTEKEKKPSYNQPCYDFGSDDGSDEGSKDGRQHSHHSQGSVRSYEDNHLVILHGHDHRKEECFIPNLAHQNGEKREQKGGAVRVLLHSLAHSSSDLANGMAVENQGSHIIAKFVNPIRNQKQAWGTFVNQRMEKLIYTAPTAQGRLGFGFERHSPEHIQQFGWAMQLNMILQPLKFKQVQSIHTDSDHIRVDTPQMTRARENYAWRSHSFLHQTKHPTFQRRAPGKIGNEFQWLCLAWDTNPLIRGCAAQIGIWMRWHLRVDQFQCATQTGGQFKCPLGSIPTLDINIMASRTSFSPDSHTLNQNSNSLAKKVEDEDTNHTTTRQRIRPPTSCEEPSNEQSSALQNEEKVGSKISEGPQSRIFDIRVGLGLKDATVEACRKKFQHLLPPYLSALISKKHLSLLNIADKIDNYLNFQREMRGVKSALYSEIAKNIQENYNIEAGVHQLRQILYLNKDLYVYRVEKKKSSYDLRLSVNGKYEGAEPRRTILRRCIFEFLNAKHEEFLKQKRIERKQVSGYWEPQFSVDIPIPLLPLPWQQTVPKNPEVAIQSKLSDTQYLKTQQPESSAKQPCIKLTTLSTIQGKKQSNLKEIINKSTVGESFRDKLYRIVAEKESQIKAKQAEKQKQKEMNLCSSITKLSKDSYVKVIDEINMLYTLKKISNIFYVNLVEGVAKRTGFHKGQIEDAIKDILAKGSYLNEINTDNGTIIRVNKGLYHQFRNWAQNSMT